MTKKDHFKQKLLLWPQFPLKQPTAGGGLSKQLLSNFQVEDSSDHK